MAKISEWHRRDCLRSLIAQSLEEIGYEGGNASVAISPELDEVYAAMDVYDDGLNERISQGWSLESADTFEEIVNRADLYFDLR